MSETAPLFGTDGIRGQVPPWPLVADVVARLGQASAEVARAAGYAPLAVIGRDTRRSGPMLEAALAAGLMERGMDVASLGILPTPAVAFLARHFAAGLGVVISASHNPHPDNGIKFFAGTGFKFPDELERAVEALLMQTAPAPVPYLGPVGRPVAPPSSPAEAYLERLLVWAGGPGFLQGRHLVLDCAHGATYQVAPELFRRLGAQVTVLCAEPDGENINRDCGSEHPQALREAVLGAHADAGLAFDGDGDRALLVDETGRYLDGDQMLAILARDLHGRGQLRNATVVGTVMSNLGLEHMLEGLGLRLERVSVGDRHVARRMLDGDFVLGGEPSGHVVVFGEGSTTGDGLYTAVKVLAVAVREKQSLSALAAAMVKFPQVIVNVPVQGRPPLESLPEVQEATALVRQRLGRVRLLLRYSGTQPLARVMVEGEDEARVRWAAEALAEAVRKGIDGAQGHG